MNHPMGSNEQKVNLTVIKRMTIRKSDKTNWFPNIHRMANGNLIVACQTAPDETSPDATEVGRRFLSVDNGETWRELEARIEAGGPCEITLRDGTFLQLWFYTVRRGDGWVTKVVRSIDNGLTYTTTNNVPVHIDNVGDHAHRLHTWENPYVSDVLDGRRFNLDPTDGSGGPWRGAGHGRNPGGDTGLLVRSFQRLCDVLP